MRIKLLFFGLIREIFGCDSLWMKIPPGTCVRDVVHTLSREPQAFALNELPLVYAVNERFETAEATLREDDELALMTPVAGG